MAARITNLIAPAATRLGCRAGNRAAWTPRRPNMHIRSATGSRRNLWAAGIAIAVAGNLFASRAAGDEIHVWEGQSIQAAIDAASEGDEIIVHLGVYEEAIDLLGKAITVRGTDPDDPFIVENTIIDANGAYHVVRCDSGETPDTVLAGFTLTGGNANGSFPDSSGGGVLCCGGSSPTLKSCIISNNSAEDWGGGLVCDSYSNPTLTCCTISGNAGSAGAGLSCLMSSGPTIMQCTISGNVADTGGGVYCCYASPEFTNCVISNNVAPIGGGMHCEWDCGPTLTNCVVSDNRAWDGGGLYLLDAKPTLRNCTLSGNLASFYGGAVYCWSSTTGLANCILWGDSPQEIYVVPGSDVVVTYCDVQGGWSGEGNLNANPLFTSPSGGNYRIGAGSPCIDAGNNTAVPDGIITDLDGNPRFVDDPNTDDTGVGFPCVDVGAYEFQVEDDCPADVNDDGLVNIDDLFAALAAWGACDDCPEDINNDGFVDIDDIFEVLAAWGPCP